MMQKPWFIIATVIGAVLLIGLGLSARTPAHQQASTVEFIVSGSAADVTYGPSGSSLSGSVPLDVSVTIPSPVPSYYAINAQLQGAGAVTCEIKVDGAVISAGHATGGYNITTCEIIQGPSGDWESAT